MSQGRKSVCVIGAANVDIAGQAAGPLIARDSNLGSVMFSHGGVGRNIAHNLALLGVDVHLIAPFGDDALADDLLRACMEAGIKLEGSYTIEGATSSSYLYICDAQGEMQLAINDMAIVESLDRDHLEQRLELIEAANVCVIDANLNAETLAWISEHVSAPIFCDPISSVKAGRISPILGHLHTLKPNLLEAKLLTGAEEPEDAADELLGTGLSRAFISLGERGLLAAEGDARLQLPRIEGSVVNTTGAGDAMMAGLVWAYIEGLDLNTSARAGLASSAICVESEQTVNPQLTAQLLKQRMEKVHG